MKAITFITITGLFLFTACQKEPVPKNKGTLNSNPLFGTWVCTDNNYTDTLLWWYICGEEMEVYQTYKNGKLQLSFTDSTIIATNSTPVHSLFDKILPTYTTNSDTLQIINQYSSEYGDIPLRFSMTFHTNDSIRLEYIGSLVISGFTLTNYSFKKLKE